MSKYSKWKFIPENEQMLVGYWTSFILNDSSIYVKEGQKV